MLIWGSNVLAVTTSEYIRTHIHEVTLLPTFATGYSLLCANGHDVRSKALEVAKSPSAERAYPPDCRCIAALPSAPPQCHIFAYRFANILHNVSIVQFPVFEREAESLRSRNAVRNGKADIPKTCKCQANLLNLCWMLTALLAPTNTRCSFTFVSGSTFAFTTARTSSLVLLTPLNTTEKNNGTRCSTAFGAPSEMRVTAGGNWLTKYFSKLF